eukprot:CCRYP_012686-RB/>CCRYP_012686-RB protein AED:0.04 eAED:0.04 QI:1036/1/1/1/0.33/0.25/4/1891/119
MKFLQVHHVLSLALLLPPRVTSGMNDEAPMLRGNLWTRLVDSDFPGRRLIDTENTKTNDKHTWKKRKTGNAKQNRDGTWDGHGAWRTSQCVSTGYECYVGDFCCSGGGCPSCNEAPCKC